MPRALSNDERIRRAEDGLAYARQTPEPSGRERTYYVQRVRSKLLAARNYAYAVVRERSGASESQREQAQMILEQVEQLWPVAR